MGRVDLLTGLNGAIAGLVAITAGPDIVDHYWAILNRRDRRRCVCAVGIKVLEHLRIDDVVGAVPAHLFAGVWGHARRVYRRWRRSGSADFGYPGDRGHSCSPSRV